MEAIKIKKEKFDLFYYRVFDYIVDIDNNTKKVDFHGLMDLARDCVGEFNFYEQQILFHVSYYSFRGKYVENGYEYETAIKALALYGIIVEE